MNDFSISAYRELVGYAVNNFEWASYLGSPPNNAIIWRHDCDFSLSKASEIAAIDHEEGMRSNFFINLHATTYNARSKSGQLIVRSFLDYGHTVGIHLDVAYYGDIWTEDRLAEVLIAEQVQFESHFGLSPKAFSFHNPTNFEMNFLSQTYAGIVNCYSKEFRTDYRYASDSNGYWRHQPISDVMRANSQIPLQVLTHPAWWSIRPFEARERLVQALAHTMFFELSAYDRNLVIYGRENRSDFVDALHLLKGIPEDLQIVFNTLLSFDFIEAALNLAKDEICKRSLDAPNQELLQDFVVILSKKARTEDPIV